MRIAAGRKRNENVSPQRDVAGDFFPDEMKSVRAEPHVGAAAVDGVDAIFENSFSRKLGGVDVGGAFKNSDGSLDRNQSGEGKKNDRAQHKDWPKSFTNEPLLRCKLQTCTSPNETYASWSNRTNLAIWLYAHRFCIVTRLRMSSSGGG